MPTTIELADELPTTGKTTRKEVAPINHDSLGQMHDEHEQGGENVIDSV